jgi:hypothetical protein
MALNDVADPVSRERSSVGIDEHRSRWIMADAAFRHERPHQSGCLRPQRTDPFFAAFTGKPDSIGAIELECRSGEIDGLLHARARVLQECEQRIIASTARCTPIDAGEQCFHFRALQVVDGPLASPMRIPVV